MPTQVQKQKGASFLKGAEIDITLISLADGAGRISAQIDLGAYPISGMTMTWNADSWPSWQSRTACVSSTSSPSSRLGDYGPVCPRPASAASLEIDWGSRPVSQNKTHAVAKTFPAQLAGPSDGCEILDQDVGRRL